MHVLVVKGAQEDLPAGERDHRLHLLLEAGRGSAHDDAVGGEREGPGELALELGDVLLPVHDGAVLLLLRRADRGILRLVSPAQAAPKTVYMRSGKRVS